MTASYFHVKIGDYLFEATPAVEPECERVVRQNALPNEAVAVNWTIPLACRVRETEDAGTAALLGAFLAECLHTRSCPPVLVTDQAGTPVPEWGEIDPDAVDESFVNLGWEDMAVVAYRLPQGEGQLLAGATFFLTIKARRSFPDADGICELDQEYEESADASGNTVKRLTTSYVRFSRASGVNVDDPDVAARLTLAAPPGYVRTVGGDRGFTFREPFYPSRHVATGIVSEVTLVGAASGSTGATSASLTHTIVDDPSRGLRRLTDGARQTGGDDPLGWVEDQAPSSLLVSTETTLEEGNENSANGEWKRIEAIEAQGKTTKVVRTFALRGGHRQVGAILMSPPVRPVTQRGAFEPYRITETIEVYALDPRVYADFKLPDPLGNPAVLGAEDVSLPRVAEDAVAIEQRLWVWAVSREYGWDGNEPPHAFLSAFVFAGQPT